MAQDSHLHSLLKAISWRIFGSLATAGLVYLFTQNKTAALSVGGAEAFGKIFLFYAHERLWNQFRLRGIKGAARRSLQTESS
jgi:uncharacterized membrane protein